MDLPGLTWRSVLKADPFVQLRLLDVQTLDSRLDVLQHQLDTLPETARLEEARLRRTQVDNRVRDLRVLVDDLTAEQQRADSDVESVKRRRERDQGMVDSGSISDPRALERMLGELQSLNRRIGDLEDVELEVMERLEEAQERLRASEEEVAQLDKQVEELTAQRDQTAAGLRKEQEEARAERATTADGVPGDLLTLYEKLRTQRGGVGAAPLHRRECQGCRLALNAADLGRIAKAPADEVLRCEECGRILVRTSESGL